MIVVRRLAQRLEALPAPVEPSEIRRYGVRAGLVHENPVGRNGEDRGAAGSEDLDLLGDGNSLAGELETPAVERSRDKRPCLEIEQMPDGRPVRARDIGDVGSKAQELLLVPGVERSQVQAKRGVLVASARPEVPLIEKVTDRKSTRLNSSH